MKKWKIPVAILAVLIGLSFAKDGIIKFSIEQGVRAVTGLHVKIGSLRVGFLFRQVVEIRDLRVYNPPGYAERVMADIPLIYAEYDLKTAASSKIFIHDLELFLREFQVVRNKEGVSNVEGITLPKSGEKKDLAIGNLHLRIEKVSLRDYSQAPPLTREYNVNINENFQRIENLNALVRVVLLRAITSSAVKNFANYDVKELKHSVAKIVSGKIREGVNKALQRTTDRIKSFFGRKPPP